MRLGAPVVWRFETIPQHGHRRPGGGVLPWLLAFVLLSGALARTDAYALVAGAIRVEGLSSLGEDELLSMMALGPGRPIDRAGIQTGIKRAFLKGCFEDISVEVGDGESPEVIVRVTERQYVRKIRISGDSALSGSALRSLFRFKEDDLMRSDLLEDAGADLREKLAFRGYPDSRVSITATPVAPGNRVDLFLDVTTREPLLIRTVRFVGVETDLSDSLKISAGDVYDQKKLEEALNRLRDDLKKEGYIRPVVGPYRFSDGELVIVLDPGKRLAVNFDGNDAISERELLKETAVGEMEAFGDWVIGEAVDRMIARYHREGYPFAKIAPVIDSDEKEIRVSFFIFEGERFSVRSITFQGATVPDETLKRVLALREGGVYDPDLAEKEKDALREYYGAGGYLGAEISDMDVEIDDGTSAVDITFDIIEGPKTVIAEISLSGVDADRQAAVLEAIGIRPGDPYNEVEFANARYRILDSYGTAGYTGTDVQISRKIEDGMASVTFAVQKGVPTRFGKTIVTGNRRTRYEVIRRELTHADGDPLRPNLLAEERQRLYKLGLFTDVSIETTKGEGDQRDIIVRVREGNAGSFDFGFGYASYERFRGYAEVSYRNLWGMNRQVLLRTELSSLEKRFILQYTEPWFLGRRLPFRGLILLEDKEELTIPERDTRYRLKRYTATGGIEKKLESPLKIEFYYELSQVETFDVQPDVVLSKEDTGTLLISAIRPSLVYDTRDNPFDPSAGFLAGVSLKYATPLLFSETNFLKITLHASRFHRLARRVVLALSVRGGMAFGFGDTVDLPIVERFFLGGRTTVRGYEQDELGPKGDNGDPTGGNAFVCANIEARIAIGRGFGLVPFLDAGNVWQKTRDMRLSDLRYTAGMGIRYGTPVGPLSVDYGYKLDRKDGETSGEIHFMIGHAF